MSIFIKYKRIVPSTYIRKAMVCSVEVLTKFDLFRVHEAVLCVQPARGPSIFFHAEIVYNCVSTVSGLSIMAESYLPTRPSPSISANRSPRSYNPTPHPWLQSAPVTRTGSLNVGYGLPAVYRPTVSSPMQHHTRPHFNLPRYSCTYA